VAAELLIQGDQAATVVEEVVEVEVQAVLQE
jgi:hypothetical protein